MPSFNRKPRFGNLRLNWNPWATWRKTPQSERYMHRSRWSLLTFSVTFWRPIWPNWPHNGAEPRGRDELDQRGQRDRPTRVADVVLRCWQDRKIQIRRRTKSASLPQLCRYTLTLSLLRVFLRFSSLRSQVLAKNVADLISNSLSTFDDPLIHDRCWCFLALLQCTLFNSTSNSNRGATHTALYRLQRK